MTPLQVQFCYEIACGNAGAAKALLQQMSGDDDLLAENEWGCSPASFCLWAANQPNSHIVFDKLKEFFPTIKTLNLENNTTIEEVVCQVITPKLKSMLLHFLLQIVNRVAVHDIDRRNVRMLFDLEICITALRFVLSSPAFRDVDGAKLDITRKILGKLPQLSLEDPASSIEEDWTSPIAAPASVKKVREELPPAPIAHRWTGYRHPGVVPLADEHEDKENVPNAPLKANSHGFYPSGGPHSGTQLQTHQKSRMPQSLQAILATTDAPKERSSIFHSFFTPNGRRH